MLTSQGNSFNVHGIFSFAENVVVAGVDISSKLLTNLLLFLSETLLSSPFPHRGLIFKTTERSIMI